MFFDLPASWLPIQKWCTFLSVCWPGNPAFWLGITGVLPDTLTEWTACMCKLFIRTCLAATRDEFRLKGFTTKMSSQFSPEMWEGYTNTLVMSELIVFTGKYKSNVLTTNIFTTGWKTLIWLIDKQGDSKYYSHLHSFLHGADQLVVFPYLQ